MAGLYIHIPFCKQACYYCDFYFSTNQENRAAVIGAIVSEMALQKDYLGGETVETIYLGGGTPSLLSPQELDVLIDAVHANYSIVGNPELSLEANPDDLTKERLEYFRRAGVNRLSIGVQSFNNTILKFLNRVHDSEIAKRSINEARECGIENISLDLIYAIPDHSDNAWRNDISEALSLKPQHISSYSLTIEDKTVFGKWAKQGKMKAVDDDTAARQLTILVEMLAREDYEQYEVSNFSKPGFYSLHNSSYWKDNKYLGVGPSAHSYNGISRQFNVSNNHLYLNAIADEKIPCTIELLSREDKINEYLLTSLRTSWGADLNTLREKFSHDLLPLHTEYIQSLRGKGLLVLEKDIIRLTQSGKLLADKIASDLFVIVSCTVIVISTL